PRRGPRPGAGPGRAGEGPLALPLDGVRPARLVPDAPPRPAPRPPPGPDAGRARPPAGDLDRPDPVHPVRDAVAVRVQHSPDARDPGAGPVAARPLDDGGGDPGRGHRGLRPPPPDEHRL